MGNLKPGVKYIYERSDGIVYARESGADPSTRQVVGYDHGAAYDPYKNQHAEDQLWEEIRNLARTNETLRTELERVIIVYNLIKEQNQTPIAWHPV